MLVPHKLMLVTHHHVGHKFEMLVTHPHVSHTQTHKFEMLVTHKVMLVTNLTFVKLEKTFLAAVRTLRLFALYELLNNRTAVPKILSMFRVLK